MHEFSGYRTDFFAIWKRESSFAFKTRKTSFRLRKESLFRWTTIWSRSFLWIVPKTVSRYPVWYHSKNCLIAWIYNHKDAQGFFQDKAHHSQMQLLFRHQILASLEWELYLLVNLLLNKLYHIFLKGLSSTNFSSIFLTNVSFENIPPSSNERKLFRTFNSFRLFNLSILKT